MFFFSSLESFCHNNIEHTRHAFLIRVFFFVLFGLFVGNVVFILRIIRFKRFILFVRQMSFFAGFFFFNSLRFKTHSQPLEPYIYIYNLNYSVVSLKKTWLGLVLFEMHEWNHLGFYLAPRTRLRCSNPLFFALPFSEITQTDTIFYFGCWDNHIPIITMCHLFFHRKEN